MGWPQPLETLSEDCLYLNVYAPPSLPEVLVPVMFWLHGGGFSGGGGNETRLNGTWDVALLHAELLVITMNYRLGAFGFLASDELRSRDPSGSTGNYGILDQRLALQWVQSNIQAFGGDPRRVFLVGQSAGANSVSQHLVRPRSWGLFSSAGLESGAFYDGPDPATVRRQRPQYERFLRHLGCSGDGRVACLLAAPARRLLDASMAEGSEAWGPVVDGTDLAEAGVRLAARGALAPVPVLVGSAAEDGLDVDAPSCQGESCTESDFRAWARSAFAGVVGRNFTDAEVDRMAALYGSDGVPPGSYARWYWAAQHAGADQWSGCYARRTAGWVTTAGRQAFLYRWTYAPKGPNGDFPTLAHHSVEQPFVFHVLAETPEELREDGGKYHVDASDAELSAAVVRLWAGMAAHGRPANEARWPAFDGALRRGLQIGARLTVEGNLRGPQCDFWDEHFPPLTPATILS